MRKNSRTKTTIYIHYDKLGNESIRYIRSELKKLYGKNDGITNGFAITVGNKVFIIDSGCDAGNITFGVRKAIVIKNKKLRAEYVKRKNNDAISKGHIDIKSSLIVEPWIQ